MPRKGYKCEGIAVPVGPFSPMVGAGGFLFISGQVAQDPGTGRLVTGDVEAQTEQIFKNLEQLLRAAGKGLPDVVRTNVFLANMQDYPAMNAVYGRFFEAPYPARTTIGVAALPLGAAVEMDFVVR